MLETKVNGEVRQHESTADMLFDIPASVGIRVEVLHLRARGTYCSPVRLPGSVWSASTFLKAGDIVELSATGIGSMTQRVTTS